MMNKKGFALLTIILLISNVSLHAKLKMKEGSSKLEVNANASFVAKTTVKNLTGQLVKDEGASVSGENIEFNGGTFQDGENKTQITGSLDSTNNEISLSGNQSLKVQSGKVSKGVAASGSGNRIEGLSTLDNDIVLQDQNTTVTLALAGQLLSNIVGNGGTIYLEQGLSFADGKLITGDATVKLNNQRLSLGSTDLTWSGNVVFDNAQDISLNANLHLASTWTLAGASILNGNGNTLYLDAGGAIVIDEGASLLIKDVIINGVTDTNIRCLDAAGNITLQNVVWIQAGDYTFATGALEFKNSVEMTGDALFVYATNQTSTIAVYSDLMLDQGFTFSYDPSIVAQNLLEFIDQTSELLMNGATLHTTVTGLVLTKGKMKVLDDSTLASEILITSTMGDQIDTGITFGADLGADDFVVSIPGNVTLHCSQGSLNYRNVNSASWNMANVSATLRMHSDTSLNLYQNLNLGAGFIVFEDATTLAYASGKSLSGSINPLGTLTRAEL